jgi:hypothetical protein
MVLTTSVIAGLFALGLPLLLYILKPLFQPSPSRSSDDTATKEVVELGIERERSFRALADLDFDYESGKISKEDYEPLRASLLEETAEVLARIDARIAAKQSGRRATAPKAKRAPTPTEDAVEREIARFKRAKKTESTT